MANDAVISTEGRNLLRQESLCYPELLSSSTVSLLSQRLDEHKERMIMKAKRKIFLDCASNADPCALVVN